MKLSLSIFSGICLFLSCSLPLAKAFQSENFRGLYPILSVTEKSHSKADDPERTEFILVDVDTLENIWITYAKEKLPENLVPLKDEPSVIVLFTNRNTLFLALEKSVLFNDRYLAIRNPNGNSFEIAKRAENQFDAGVKEENRVTIYQLGGKQ